MFWCWYQKNEWLSDTLLANDSLQLNMGNWGPGISASLQNTVIWILGTLWYYMSKYDVWYQRFIYDTIFQIMILYIISYLRFLISYHTYTISHLDTMISLIWYHRFRHLISYVSCTGYRIRNHTYDIIGSAPWYPCPNIWHHTFVISELSDMKSKIWYHRFGPMILLFQDMTLYSTNIYISHQKWCSMYDFTWL